MTAINAEAHPATDFDLTPNPRVLQMLGEIDLPQWRCLAELIDNSVDGFLSAERAGQPLEAPEVILTLPRADNEAARITVSDNGPGMTVETLEHAVQAGWSGNSPLGNLGLFGMGFNIATARLGLVTEVWTSRAGDAVEVGVRIDFTELRAERSFRVPRQSRAKADPSSHGTQVVISRLKQDQRAWLAKSANTASIRKNLAKTYSALLAPDRGHAVFRLEVNTTRIVARRHCVWNADRYADTPNGVVHAVERFDVPLPPRRYCSTCMITLPESATACTTGSPTCNVVEMQRSVRGWVGIQRYLHDSDFGIDFIRNGRKIELANKDLFQWKEGDTAGEIEYPIDDQRKRGRFVGEIHLDHCRVSYTKDRFERDDPAWEEMLRVVRGEGPLQPVKARTLGYGLNARPLFRLFQAFRRTSPQGKNGLWSKILVIKDNERAIEMAGRFESSDPEYLDDEPWMQLVLEQDAAVLGAPPAAPPGAPPSTDFPPGFVDPPAPPEPTTTTQPVAAEPVAPPPPARRPIFELTRKYVHPTYRVEYDVQGFAVAPNDPDLGLGMPWSLPLTDVSTRTYAFLVDIAHPLYRSTTMTPLDALLIELAHRTHEFLRERTPEASLASILAEFRDEYCAETKLDAGDIIVQASNTMSQIALSLQRNLTEDEAEANFNGLSDDVKTAVTRKMVTRGVGNPRQQARSGTFLSYAENGAVREFVLEHPHLFFDGKYWDDAYQGLDFNSDELTGEGRRGVLRRYDGYLADAVWLASQSPADLERTGRDALIRARLSLNLLRPDTAE